MTPLENIVSFLKDNNDFFIATHLNPEGDALGSAIALSMALESLGKNTVVYDKDPVPEFYKFLPGYNKITNSVSSLDTKELSLILLDCNTPDRAGIEKLTFKHTVVIDHHETETNFGDIKWVEPQTPATGLMIFKLLKEMGIKITQDIAVNLYAAIAVDTGTFRYSNTSSEVLKAAAELAEAGANPGFIAESIHESWSRNRFKLLCMALSTLEIIDSVAFIVVTKDMFNTTETLPSDTENFSNVPRMMKDIKVSVFFRETDEGYWKVSLRSKRDFNVARIAEQFDGGGHKNAAGCTIKADLKTAKRMLLEAIRGQ
jgi:phosphoesterase RecJ-like protein